MHPEKIPRSIMILLIEDNPTDALLVREALAQASLLSCTVTHAERLSSRRPIWRSYVECRRNPP